ncbi:MAG TPA: hypothetical protein VK610_01450 [Rhodothermales bacterium]|nr:hypothetical protein [Rhodothermales bacterium]
MGASYIIAGRRFYRRSRIKLTRVERDALATAGRVVVRRPVEWPLPDRRPHFDRAYTEPGGTDLWGTEPYLKVPNAALPDGPDEGIVNRVFCPWGYPPHRLRLARTSGYVLIKGVGLDETPPGAWSLALTLHAA